MMNDQQERKPLGKLSSSNKENVDASADDLAPMFAAKLNVSNSTNNNDKAVDDDVVLVDAEPSNTTSTSNKISNKSSNKEDVVVVVSQNKPSKDEGLLRACS